jgi:hypothetical protein
MARESTVVAMRWDGAHTVKAARSAIARGSQVEIELPLEDHYALYRHLHPGSSRGGAEDIDATGGAELLASIASVAGLEEMRHLQPAVQRARYGVRLTSPEPLLRLLPPAGRRATASAAKAAGR